jgi:hypothetical protein
MPMPADIAPTRQPSGLRWIMLPSHIGLHSTLLRGTICTTTANIDFSSTFLLCLISINHFVSIALYVTAAQDSLLSR